MMTIKKMKTRKYIKWEKNLEKKFNEHFYM